MASIESRDGMEVRNRALVFVLLGLITLGGAAIAIAYFNRPPQMGADEDVFRTVDALYTAVGMKDETRVAVCAARLREYRQAGKLPKRAADALDRVIAQARGGKWQPAAEDLYAFMLAQRREGAGEPGPNGRRADPKREQKGNVSNVRP